MANLPVGSAPVEMDTDSDSDSGDGNMADTVSGVHSTAEDPGVDVDVPSSKTVISEVYRFDSMERQLRAAAIVSGSGDRSDKSSKFIPLDKIQDIVCPSSVKRELETFCRFTDSDRESLIKLIFAPPGCRKIFAILALVERVKDITTFVKEGLSDDDLPFYTTQKHKTSVNTVCLPKKLLEEWPNYMLEVFEAYQWMVLAPIFDLRSRRINHYVLENTVCLPFVEDTEDHIDSGGFSDVWRVRIHHAHLRTDTTALEEDNPPFAIKRLRHHSRECFDNEVLALKRLSGSSNPHVIQLLATYEHKHAYHLIFPWAGGNLFNLWKANPQPDILSLSTANWLKSQLLGLVEGLCAIHRLDTAIPQSSITFPATPRNTGLGDQDARYGRHGDIKPENILWFSTSSKSLGTSDLNLGKLIITDFGLTRFHSKATISRTMARTVPVTPTYRPPESDIGNQFVSQNIDIWSLGCLFLELSSWILAGWDSVVEFSNRRARDDWGFIKEDKFFEVMTADLTVINEPRDSAIGVLKPAVVQWSNQLLARTNCTGYMHDLISLIMNRMLQIDPENRISAHNLFEVLRKMSDKSARDESYLSQPCSGRDIYHTCSRPWIRKTANPVGVLNSGTTGDRGKTPALTNHLILTNGVSSTTARGSSEKRRKVAHPGGDHTAYSCPFRKRNPVRFNIREYQTCALSSFPDISQVKRHIQSVHGTASCGSAGGLDVDGRVAIGDPECGLSAAAGAKLRDRRISHQVLDWDSLWGVLFPDDMVIPSGEYEPVVEDHEMHRWLIEGSDSFHNLFSSMKPTWWMPGSGWGSGSLEDDRMPTAHVWSVVEAVLSHHFRQRRTSFTSSQSEGSFERSTAPSSFTQTNRHTTKTRTRTTKAAADSGAKRVVQIQGRHTGQASEPLRQLAPIPPLSSIKPLALFNLEPVNQPATHYRGPSVTNGSSMGSNLTGWSCNQINTQSPTPTAITEPENDIGSSKRKFEDAFPEFSIPGNISTHQSQHDNLGSMPVDCDIQKPESFFWDEMMNDQDMALDIDARFDSIPSLDSSLLDSHISDLAEIPDPHTYGQTW